SILKTVTSVTDTNHDGITGDAGDTIAYNVHVGNTTHVTQTNVTVTYAVAGGTLATGVTIAVKGTKDYATSYVLTQADIDSHGSAFDGTSDNKVTNTATSHINQSAPTSSSTHSLHDALPILSILKTVTSVTDTNNDGITGDAGDTIAYNV